MSNKQLQLSVLSLLVSWLSCSAVFAQTSVLTTAQDKDSLNAPRVSLTITAMALGDHVRITAPSFIVQMHVEVFAASGEKLFDQEIRAGNVFDWRLQDGQGQRLTAGDYVCVVTVKNIAGRLTQKIGVVRVGEKDVTVAPAEIAQLSPQQSQAIGPVEENFSWTILDDKENQTTTVIAHDGTDGQIVRGRGALSFRLGDFFSGNDKEQMRLTEDGRLGIGTANPQATLDVAGFIRTTKGVEFSDGTVQTTGLSGRKDKDGNVVPNVAGTGTQNRLTKWTDNAGTLGDSVAIDTGTGLQMTAVPSLAADTNLLYLNSNNGTTGMLAGNTPSYGANNGPFFAMRGNTYATIPNQRGLFTIAAGNVPSPQGDDGSVKFNTGNDQLRMVIRPNGNVGVATLNPTSLLDVAGDINTSTQFNIGGSRILSNAGGGNLFAGVGAGPNVTGTANSFFGANAGLNNALASSNSFFGANAGRTVLSSGSNSFFGANAGFSTTACCNTFFGASAGQNNSGGQANSFFGRNSGTSNTSGSNNTLVGASANVGAGDLVYATAIGSDAVVNSSNTLVLGRAIDSVQIPGNLNLTGANGLSVIATANSPGNNTAFFQNTAIGPNVSHVHWGTTGDWYIRSAASAGRVILQDSGGNVGIGTANPVGNLHINVPSSGNPINALTVDVQSFQTPANAGASYFFKVRDVGSGAPAAFLIRGDGNVGIGTADPTSKLQVSGTGIVRSSVNSDLNAGISLGLNNQPKWSLATTPGAFGTGNFQLINNSTIGQIAPISVDGFTNNILIGGTTVPITPTFTLQVAGDVGIGAVNPRPVAVGLERLEMIRGWVQTDGTILAGTGFTVTRIQTGIYTVDFSNPFPNGFTPVVSIVGGLGFASFAFNNSRLTVNTVNPFALSQDMSFTFIVMGAR